MIDLEFWSLIYALRKYTRLDGAELMKYIKSIEDIDTKNGIITIHFCDDRLPERIDEYGHRVY